MVGGIVVARYGTHVIDVIDNVKERIKEIATGLPEGVKIETVYDRSQLIERAIDTLKRTLAEEAMIVALVCVVFLLHARSALVAILMLPVGVLMAFVAMRWLGINANIMSLGGIAIAIGAMIDAAIVMIENAHKHLERAPPDARASAADPRRLHRGRTGAVLQPADHHGVVPAGVHAGGAGRTDVRAARVHEDLRDGGVRAAVGHAGAGADAALHPRQGDAGEEEPDQSLPDLDLPADHRLGPASPRR